MKIRTTILQTGKNTTGIEVTPEMLEELGGGKRPAVKVTINGHTYRSSVGSMGGQSMISLSAENRDKAGVAGGDEVDVQIAPDTEPREVEVPSDLAAALKAQPAAKATFDELSYSNKRYHVLQVEGAKTDETRQRRIANAVETLASGKPR